MPHWAAFNTFHAEASQYLPDTMLTLNVTGSQYHSMDARIETYYAHMYGDQAKRVLAFDNTLTNQNFMKMQSP